jgi:hypothetical protein
LANHGNTYGHSQNNAGGGAQDFSGTGMIYVTYMPDPVINGSFWNFQGEIVEGIMEQCDWEPLAGTVFWSSHNSNVRVDEQFNAVGTMWGTFSLTRPDGSGSLNGTFTGRIRGNLYTGDIYDEGNWSSTYGTGCFEDIKAWGKWSAELHYGDVGGQTTLVGPMCWSGKYIEKPNLKPNIKPISWQCKENARATIWSHIGENVRSKMSNFCDKHRNNRNSHR